MLLTVFCAPRDRPEITFSLDVSPELELRDFIALCELESGIPAGDIQISYAEQPLQDPARALGAYGLKDGDVVVLRQAERRPPAQPNFPGLPRIDFSSIAVPGTSSGQPPVAHTQPQTQNQQRLSPSQGPPFTGSALSPQGLDNPSLLRDMLLANPHELSLLKERNPPLADALLSGDLERFTKVLVEQQQERARREQERIRLLTSDPFDLEAQAKIEEDIRQHNIEENMTIAMEEAPESFGQVVMLYINCKVNGHPVKAFVDSGAQMTIMSQACAERCNIMRLVDRRWAGIAKGVGTQKIIGRVHLAQVQIEGDFLPCSFSILEDQPMDMLLGLDMLKRHQCSIDLKKSVLLIGTTGTETRFLPEAELPDCARLAYGADARPEEIADRELAEALQRSAQESGEDFEDGQTTSPQSLPWSLPTHNDKIPVSTSCPDHPQNPALDRSKSAPAALHHPLPEGLSWSGPSQRQCNFQGLDEAPSTSLVTEEVPDPQIDSFLLIPASSPQDVPNCASAEDEALRQSGTLGNVEGVPITAMEVGAAAGEEEQQSGTLASNAHSDLVREAAEADVALTAKTQLQVSLEHPDTQNDREEVDADMESANLQHLPPLPLNAKLLPEVHLRTGSPDFLPDMLSESSSCSAELPMSAENMCQLERGDPEGDQQPASDSMPSLASALKELHALLTSSGHSLLPDRSPLPFARCREDADDVNEGTEPRFVTSAWEHVPLTTAAASAIETPGAEFEDSLHASNVPFDFEFVDSDQVEELERKVLEECKEGEELRFWGALGASEAHGSVAEEQGIECEPEVDPVPQTSFEGMEVRQPPEGQQGRGVADGRAEASEPSILFHPELLLSEVSAPSPEEPIPSTLCHSTELEVSGPSACGSDSGTPTSLLDAAPLSQPIVPPPPVASPHAPPPLMERFPLAHIQRIQDAGFSAGEATEALEQAEGVVDLALLKLLARKITVPT